MTDTFPRRVEPVPGETLLSVVDRLADAHGMSVGTAYDVAGVNHRNLSVLTPIADPAATARALRLDLDTVRDLTWLADVTGAAGDKRLRELSITTFARPCGACLAETPAWLSGWHVRWLVACPRHRLLLLDGCDDCGKPYRARLSRARRSPERCGNPLGRAACTAVVDPARQAPATSEVLGAQATVGRLLARSISHDQFPASTISLLTYLSRRRADLHGGRFPTTVERYADQLCAMAVMAGTP